MGNLVLFLGALPALLAMWYFDRLDAKRPEPRSSLRRVAIAGAIAVVPCAVIELMIDALGPHRGYGGAVFKGFIVAAAVEELAKVLCVRWFIWNRPEFDEQMDGITYATRAGLGFALIENILYLLVQKDLKHLAIVAVLRALLAVPGHAIYAGIMGYFAAQRRFERRGPGLLGGYVIAVLMHGTYDAGVFCAIIAGKEKHMLLAVAFGSLPLWIVGIGAFVLRRMVRTATAADDRAFGTVPMMPPGLPPPRPW